MRQHLDIADVEDRTKIRAKYLRALENEEFGQLPGSTFVKTFLRTYAETLGLDPQLLVEEYRAGDEPQEDELELQPVGTPAAAGAGRERERRYPPGPPRRGTIVVVAAVALLAFLLVLGVTGDDEEGGGERASETSTQTERRERPARRRRRPAPSTVALRVSPTVPTYACLDTGDGTPRLFEGILQEPRTFRGRRLRINLGKTSVEMTANGRPVQFEQSPNPIGFEFTPRGNRQLPAGQRPCA